MEYSAALNSALIDANDALQPVLIIGRYSLGNEILTNHSKFGHLVERKGVKIIYSLQLLFQDNVNQA